MDAREKVENAYEEALRSIESGSSYYSLKIQETKKQIRDLAIKNGEAVRGLSAKQIQERKEVLEGEVTYLQKKSGEFVEKQKAVRSCYFDYKKNLEKKGANYIGDTNVISNLAKVRGLINEENSKDAISSAFKKESRKIEKDLGISFEKFDKTLMRNAPYIIDSNGKPIFMKGVISENTFETMLVEKNSERESNYPKKQTIEELEEQRKEILISIEEYNQVQEIMKPENEFNISEGMRKDLNKCNKLYEDISKHKQIIEKTEEVLNRFEIDEKDNDEMDKQKKDRSKEYSKLCKELHKLKQKEEKKILRLEKKVKKPMAKNNVSKLFGLVEDRKNIQENKNKINNLTAQISSKENELGELLQLKGKLDRNQEIGNNVLKFEELNKIENDIDRLQKEIENYNKELKTSKETLKQTQNKIENSYELKKYTTKSVMKNKGQEEPYIAGDDKNDSPKKSFKDNLKDQTNSDLEYNKSREERESLEKQKNKEKDKNQMSIE